MGRKSKKPRLLGLCLVNGISFAAINHCLVRHAPTGTRPQAVQDSKQFNCDISLLASKSSDNR